MGFCCLPETSLIGRHAELFVDTWQVFLLLLLLAEEAQSSLRMRPTHINERAALGEGTL